MAMMSGHVPVEINHMRQEGMVRVTWDDGHVGDYPREYLRGYCPCALCQGHGGEIKFIAAPNARLAEISAVGNYAIQFGWEDGHNTGIYTFDYLRSLCPCPQCKSSKAGAAEKEG
ncbi:MAG: hypothetical protein A2038_00660 [Deltaproteobacteria bacterium GWA2_57_13]|nr:MAG: hypothetical protein A2038_00660 [Deltaproteobacteria bacterium GWA2_57_13]OGQ51873.1 MAG: hypothetical protein A3I10_03225 [Deltaproteobacteria bacterium RIFCSPLOWO2_02_FULL_57_26]OGQ83810.1 MAG: hypothetical protein A3G40_08125 [Deltaproteobacteria bacterium RIFCSPLOWO2_12_FULL_57_22]